MRLSRRLGPVTCCLIIVSLHLSMVRDVHAAKKHAVVPIFSFGQHTEGTEHRHGGDDCDHKLVKPGKNFKKNEDSLEWWILNGCGKDQPVLLCIYPAPNPFGKCEGDGDIGVPFWAKNGLTKVTCPAKVEGKYTKQILIGSEIPATGKCSDVLSPPSPKGTFELLAHTLDIVIE